MNTSGKVLPLARLCARQFSKSGVVRAAEKVEEVPSKAFSKLKENQKRFGVDDGVPVYLKAGFTDRLLYIGTSIGVLIGSGLAAQVLFKAALK